VARAPAWPRLLDKVASFTVYGFFKKKLGLFSAVNWGFLSVFSGRRNSRGWVALGSLAQLVGFSTLANSVGDGASPPRRCWLPSRSQGNCSTGERGRVSKSQFLSDPSLPCPVQGHDQAPFGDVPG